MERLLSNLTKSINHLQSLHNVFIKQRNYSKEEKDLYYHYKRNSEELDILIGELKLDSQLYANKGRQMILSDLIEYILLGRGYYSIESINDKGKFVKLLMHLVNMLMIYDTLTVSKKLRRDFLNKLKKTVPSISAENLFSELSQTEDNVGLKKEKSKVNKDLDKYFDSLLPKTAGGLWHELLVYAFLLRSNVGYVVPLLLTQRIFSMEKKIVPPDFFIITYDKHIYGIEVGIKKEIQSGSFSLQTAIPTATLDTINSRVSDRCPICLKWIPFCDYVINKYSDFNQKIEKYEVRCLSECNIYTEDEIVSGKCAFTKYSREKTKTIKHKYTTGLHYHYKCVLKNLSKNEREKVIKSKDKIALKTHFPYYRGLEDLIAIKKVTLNDNNDSNENTQ